ALVRAMETLGEAQTAMRDALDPRVSLEVALVRVTAPEVDASPAALVERIERLERRLAAGGTAPAPAPPPAPPPPPPPAPPPPEGRALGSFRGSKAKPAGPPPAAAQGPGPPARAESQPPPAQETGASARAADRPRETKSLPSRDELTKAWGDHILAQLPARLRARFSAGRFVAVAEGTAVFALPNPAHRDQCAPMRAEVEQILAAHFGRSVPLRLTAEGPAGAGRANSSGSAQGQVPPSEVEPVDDHDVVISELREAPGSAVASPTDRVKNVFPGAQEVEP
ncbi:MAG: hypothetical protein KY458_05740, partial [Actinobacteria bacterium]|nr:hypothetical protein [Actinomycetota bacterium]